MNLQLIRSSVVNHDSTHRTVFVTRNFNKKHKMPRKHKKSNRVQPQFVEIGPFEMKAGKYYVGDLCNALLDNERKELVDKTGAFTLSNGRTGVTFNLPHGDGIYPDKNGRNFYIDSGTVGITLAEGLKEKESVTDNTFEFQKKFFCMAADTYAPQKGHVEVIYFGEHICINSEDQISGIAQLLLESGQVPPKYNFPCSGIDYIRPLASFKNLATCKMELRKALNFNNTQLTSSVDNNVKNDTYDADVYAASKGGIAIAKFSETWKQDGVCACDLCKE